MSRYCLQWWVAIAVLLIGGSGMAQPSEQAVHVEAWLQPDTSAVGDTTLVMLALKVQKGYHVNEVPPLSLELPETAPLTLLKSKVEPDSTRKNAVTRAGYRILDVSVPLSFPTLISKNAGAGQKSVTLKVTYYYCSDKEGWCSFKTVETPLKFFVSATP